MSKGFIDSSEHKSSIKILINEFDKNINAIVAVNKKNKSSSSTENIENKIHKKSALLKQTSISMSEIDIFATAEMKCKTNLGKLFHSTANRLENSENTNDNKHHHEKVNKLLFNPLFNRI